MVPGFLAREFFCSFMVRILLFLINQLNMMDIKPILDEILEKVPFHLDIQVKVYKAYPFAFKKHLHINANSIKFAIPTVNDWEQVYGYYDFVEHYLVIAPEIHDAMSLMPQKFPFYDKARNIIPRTKV